MDDLRVSFPKPCSEPWDAMAPRGCNRHCASCDKIIHDLSRMTVDEAQALLGRDREACVRARVSPKGEIALKRNSSDSGRKMLVAASASMGLLAAACQTAGNFPSKGVIAGKVQAFNSSSVTATASNGRIFRTKVQRDGSYAFKPVPYGSYALKFHGLCDSWEGGTVEVRAGQVTAPTPPEPLNDCIIIGQILVEDNSG